MPPGLEPTSPALTDDASVHSDKSRYPSGDDVDRHTLTAFGDISPSNPSFICSAESGVSPSSSVRLKVAKPPFRKRKLIRARPADKVLPFAFVAS
jgi:hypothetical protein